MKVACRQKGSSQVDAISGCYDVAVLGAGAAGLFAGFAAAEAGHSVVVLEKNRRPGVKILMSGGTRCNLTNARGMRNLRSVSGPIDPAYDSREAKGARSIQQAFGAGGAFLGPALKAFSVEATVKFFEGEGLATKIEGNGKIFPASDRAIDVVAVLVRRLERSGAALQCDSSIREVLWEDDIFRIATPDRFLYAKTVIVAVGGQSYPGCGTQGDGYGIARSFGHAIIEPRPALVPIRVAETWASDLKGLTLTDARAWIASNGGPPLLERREAVLFAHFGLTGPAILDVSRAVARHNGNDRLTLRLDLIPDNTMETLDETIQRTSRSGRGQVVGMLPGGLPRRLAEVVVASANIPADRIGPELSRDERKRLTATLKGLGMNVTGTLGFAKAEVTSGGVDLNEVDPETLQSRLQPGLFFVGEVLDLDGLIGGYNFQAAWSTGWLAGRSAFPA